MIRAYLPATAMLSLLLFHSGMLPCAAASNQDVRTIVQFGHFERTPRVEFYDKRIIVTSDSGQIKIWDRASFRLINSVTLSGVFRNALKALFPSITAENVFPPENVWNVQGYSASEITFLLNIRDDAEKSGHAVLCLYDFNKDTISLLYHGRLSTHPGSESFYSVEKDYVANCGNMSGTRKKSGSEHIRLKVHGIKTGKSVLDKEYNGVLDYRSCISQTSK